MRDGAQAAALAGNFSIQVEDAQCSAEGGAAVADRFFDANVAIVAGFLCTAAIEAALPILKLAGIPVVATGIRSEGIEAMKTFNPIRAPKAGKVTKINVSDGQPVEFGEPLMIVE